VVQIHSPRPRLTTTYLGLPVFRLRRRRRFWSRPLDLTLESENSFLVQDFATWSPKQIRESFSGAVTNLA
jgi:hypothetical protein